MSLDRLFAVLTFLAQRYWLNIIILCFLIGGTLKGLRRGSIRGIFQVVAIIVAIILAYHHFHVPIGNYLTAEFHWPGPLANAIGFVGLFLVVYGAFFPIGLILRLITWMFGLLWLERLMGAGLGLLKMALIVSFLLNGAGLFTRAIPVSAVRQGLKNQINRSLLASSLVGVAPVVYQIVINSTPLEKRFASEKYFPEVTTFARVKIKEIARDRLNKEQIKSALERGITEQDLAQIRGVIQKNIARIPYKEVQVKLTRELGRMDLDQLLKRLGKEI